MKDKIINFFKNKFNITLIILQVIAFVSYFLGGISQFFVVMFFVLEGAFFIVWGIKFLVGIGDSKYSQEIYSQLPFSEDERQRIRKHGMMTNKNNKFIGAFMIVLGVILIFSLFSMII